MNKSIGSKSYEINSFLVNPRKKLGLYALLNILQDASWSHATSLGHGHDASLARKTFWVLTRQVLNVEVWPSWGETLDVQTWIRKPTGAVAMRDYELSIKGKKIGECTTGWLLLDADTRRPVKDGAQSIAFEFREDGGALTLETPKIMPVTNADALAKFHVRNSDIDMNDHVNNTRYAQWILDAMPIQWHERFKLSSYSINFLNESKLGDTVEVQISHLEGDDSTPKVKSQYQGVRESDGKTLFTAILDAEAAKDS